MSLRKIAFECPAYISYKVEPNHTGYVHLKAGDRLACKVAGRFRRYTVGAISLDDLAPGETYEKAVAKELKKHGGKRHWINQDSVVISNYKEPQEKVLGVEIGNTILLQGKVYHLVETANNNIGLLEVRFPNA